MIGVLDYGIGNVAAFLRSFELLSVPACSISDPGGLENVSGIVLPGVGSFDMVMGRLTERGFSDELDHIVSSGEAPILGVCVGMQVMGKRSGEGALSGFGWIDGEVDRLDLPLERQRMMLPHMGWNTVSVPAGGILFRELQAPEFYFLHSYAFREVPSDAKRACSSYGLDFVSAFEFRNIYGVQFHPEKSHHAGLQLLKNFADIVQNA